MVRSGALILILALFAGAAAGTAVQFLLPPAGDSASSPVADESLKADLDDLRTEVARLRQRSEESTLALDDARGQIRALEAEVAKAAQSAKTAQFANAGEAQSARTFEILPGKGIEMLEPGGTVVKMGGAPIRLGGMGKAFELLKLTEEERWAKAREELSLDSYQEEELKRIRDEARAAAKDMMKIDPDTGQMTGKIDLGKIFAARNKAEEQVKNLLTEDQYKKYRKGGYGNVLGTGGGGMTVTTFSGFSTSEDDRGK